MIECKGRVYGNDISWKRFLNTESGSTTYSDAAEIKNISVGIKDRVRKGDQQIIIPVISYYGTGRLWAQKKEKQGSGELNLSNRFYGYTDSLSDSSNAKLMIKWFRSMTLHRLQEQIEIPELSAVEKAIAACEQELRRKNLSEESRDEILRCMSRAAESSACESAASREFQLEQLEHSHKLP